MYMCICTCTCAYVHVHVRMYMYMCVCTCTCAYVHVHVRMYMYMCVCTCTCTYVRMYMYMCVCTCMCTCAYVHVHVRMYMYVYILSAVKLFNSHTKAKQTSFRFLVIGRLQNQWGDASFLGFFFGNLFFLPTGKYVIHCIHGDKISHMYTKYGGLERPHKSSKHSYS